MHKSPFKSTIFIPARVRRHAAEKRIAMNLQAFRLVDGNSDKFWTVETLGSDMAVRFGKTGTIGKFKIKEFEDADEAEREATKLGASKTRKGYVAYPDYDPLNQFYFDDPEIGLHRLTSHPTFRANFADDLYYDCVDEEAPFGSDEGSDTLSFLEEAVRANHDLNFTAFPAHLVVDEWGMTYFSATDADLDLETVRQLVKTDEMDLTQSDMVTYASAFAQIKITGAIDPALRQHALNALARITLVAQVCGWRAPGVIQQQMRADLNAFGIEVAR
jgi:uncharacterized protein YfeS/predicted DNA-binding WGR domain protein